MRAPGHLPAAILLFALVAAGCSTQRQFTVHTDPVGADVWINQRYEGKSPVTVPFVHYGRFDVRVEKPGYRSEAVEFVLPTPVDGRPLVDLPGELTVPQRRFARSVKLTPLPSRPGQAGLAAALENARALRDRAEAARTEPGTPAPSPRPDSPSRGTPGPGRR